MAWGGRRKILGLARERRHAMKRTRIFIAGLYSTAAALGFGISWLLVHRGDTSGPVARNITTRIATASPANVVSESSGVAFPPPETLTDSMLTTRWAHHVPIEEIPDWIEKLASTEHLQALMILFRRWATENPEAAFQAALALPPLPNFKQLRFSSGGMGERFDSPLMRILNLIVPQWFASSPKAAMDAILALPDDILYRRYHLGQALAQYAKTHPAEAVRLTFDLLDPKGPVDLKFSMNSGDNRMISSLFNHWARGEPTAAISRALAIDERALQAAALEGIFKGWNGADPDAAREWVLSLGDDLPTKNTRRALLHSLAEIDPLGAIQLDSKWHGSNRIAGGILRKWAVEDAAGVIDALKDIDDPELLRQMSGLGFEYAFAKHSGPEVVAMAEGLSGAALQSALHMIAQHWGKADSRAAEAWGWQIEDPILRRTYLSDFYDGQVQLAPAETAISLENISDDALRERIAKKLAGSWPRQSPQAAAGWVTSSPAGVSDEVLVDAHRSVARVWAGQSPEDAIAWFGSLEDSAA